ncbi:MAG: hypothetical protein ACKORE_06760, partial [Bacteroidota bacterium]
MKRLAMKKGMQGILYLTRLPKLLVDSPTAKANSSANTNENAINSSDKTILVQPKIRVEIRNRNANSKMKRFSSPETSITKLLLSKISGRKIAAKVAAGNLLSKLGNVPSNSPISNEFPW